MPHPQVIDQNMEAIVRSTAGAPPLHTAKLSRLAVSNRIFAAVYASAVLALLYHRLETLAHLLHSSTTTTISSILISISLLIADLILAFMWATLQSFRMRPVYRAEYPDNLKKVVIESDFPAMDVFICTADPYKEPPMGVVNTALSVMAYDYPAEKISVYVSDDGGSALTLFAFVEAAKFAAHWLPFCRKNNVVDRSPEVFFAANDCLSSETEKIKTLYKSMKVRVESVVERGKVGDEFISGEDEVLRHTFSKWTDGFTRQDHPTIIQVVLDKSKDRDITGHVMPNLIYVSREKSRTSYHNFKAGALNVLIRVSASMTNSPIILTLDCDTYSNDPKTPQRVLCYFSDPKVQSQLGYVQFRPRFHGINKNDSYSCEFRQQVGINAMGLDGLQGPNYFGSGCFFNRRAFFGGPSALVILELPALSPYNVVNKPIQSPEVLSLAHHVAGSNYEIRTKWGFKVGVRYGTIVEDFFTGYRLQCEGWKSIFCNPERAAFYEDAPISLVDVLNQNKRWVLGFLEVSFSKYCPLTFGTRFMGPLMGLAYAHYSFWAIWSIPVAIYAFLPQLALLNGVTIFPKVSEPWFVLYIFLFLGAYGKDVLDFVVGGAGTFQKWWNDQRMWLIRSLSCFLFGCTEYFMKSLGIFTIGFNVTSKVVDEEQRKRYEQGIFEFGIHLPLFVPVTMAAITNLIALISGLGEILRGENYFERFLIQLLITGFAVVNGLPVYEAMFFRSNKGGIPKKTTLLSAFLVFTLYAIAYVTLRS